MSYYRDVRLGIGDQKNIRMNLSGRMPDITLNVSGGGSGGNCKMIMKATEQWESMPTYVPARHDIIVYTDYYDNGDGMVSPRIKLGDGSAYLVDLPWTDGYVTERVESVIQQLNAHITNEDIHITAQERSFWNNKLNYSIDDDSENLILNRN